MTDIKIEILSFMFPKKQIKVQKKIGITTFINYTLWLVW